MYDKTAIGNRIKQSRKATKMTQDELAERAGYSNRSSIARIETGLADIPGEKLLLLANILNTSVQYLQTGIEFQFDKAMYDESMSELKKKVEHLEGIMSMLPESYQDEIIRYAEYLSDKHAMEEDAAL